MDMTTVQAIISLISVTIAVSAFYFARKKDAQDVSSQSTEMIIELRTMRRDISELKGDVSAMRTEWKEDHDLLTGLAREMGAMWKIIDRLNGKKKEEHNGYQA